MEDLEVLRSSIHGLGVFLKKGVKKGGRVAYLQGRVVYKHNKSKSDALANSSWVGLSKRTWVDPAYPFKYLNHSCNPSASIKGKVTIVALKDMNPGDEVTLDYSTIEGDPLWEMKCGCGSKDCRKVIRSIEFLPKRVFDKYRPYIPSYFRNLYLSKRNSVK